MRPRFATPRPNVAPARFATSWVAAGLLATALLMPRHSDAPSLDPSFVRPAYYPDLSGPGGERLGQRRPVQQAGLITDLPTAGLPALILNPSMPPQVAAGRAQATMLTREMIDNAEWRTNTGLETSGMAARIEALETTIASLKDYLIVVAELQARSDPERGGRFVDGKAASDILEPPPPPAADRRPLVHLASYRNYEDADSGWRRLAVTYGETLAVADPQFTEIDTDSGRYVRLMAALPPGRNADKTCQAIQERGFYCRVLAR